MFIGFVLLSPLISPIHFCRRVGVGRVIWCSLWSEQTNPTKHPCCHFDFSNHSYMSWLTQATCSYSIDPLRLMWKRYFFKESLLKTWIWKTMEKLDSSSERENIEEVECKSQIKVYSWPKSLCKIEQCSHQMLSYQHCQCTCYWNNSLPPRTACRQYSQRYTTKFANHLCIWLTVRWHTSLGRAWMPRGHGISWSGCVSWWHRWRTVSPHWAHHTIITHWWPWHVRCQVLCYVANTIQQRQLTELFIANLIIWVLRDQAELRIHSIIMNPIPQQNYNWSISQEEKEEQEAQTTQKKKQ